MHGMNNAKVINSQQQELYIIAKKSRRKYLKLTEQCYLKSADSNIQGGSNMTGTDLCVNKPHCAAAVRP